MKYNLKTSVPFIILLILLMLTSCTQIEKSEKEKSTDDSEIVYSFENPQTNQNFKIVHANSLFDRYFDKVKDIPSLSKLDLYNEEIIQPVYSDCFENGEYIHMVDAILNNAPTNELKVVSELIETRKDELNALIQESLLKSAQLLPSEHDVAVCVFPSNNSNISVYTVGAGKIVIPYNENFEDDFIKVSIAHEYHHSTWTEKYVSNHSGSVLDNLIFEGKAVMFEKTVYPNFDYKQIDYTYNQEFWAKIEPDLYKKDLQRSLEILYGGKGLPLLYGYNEGYKMIKSYLDINPNQSPEEWLALSTQEIIEKGKYFDNYK